MARLDGENTVLVSILRSEHRCCHRINSPDIGVRTHLLFSNLPTWHPSGHHLQRQKQNEAQPLQLLTGEENPALCHASRLHRFSISRSEHHRLTPRPLQQLWAHGGISAPSRMAMGQQSPCHGGKDTMTATLSTLRKCGCAALSR